MRKLLRTGLVPVRARRGQAAPAERLKLRRQMKESVSLSLFMELNNLELEEELSTNGHACLGGRCLAVKMVKRAAEGPEETDLRYIHGDR